VVPSAEFQCDIVNHTFCFLLLFCNQIVLMFGFLRSSRMHHYN